MQLQQKLHINIHKIWRLTQLYIPKNQKSLLKVYTLR